MSDKKTDDGTGAEIIYHFDVEQHRIPLQQFIDTADTTKDILEDFNHQFFGGKLKYGLYVAPSEKGGLTTAIIVSLLVSGIVFKFLESDIGKGAIKGWTGEKPDYWSEKLNNKLKKILLKSDRIKKLGVDSDKTDTLSKEEEECVLSVLPSYLLSENVESLKAAGITPDKFPKAFKARTTFYDSCIDNEEVQGIAFDRSDDSWIKRDRFKGLTVDPPDSKYFPKQRLENLRVGIPDSKYFKHDTVDIVVSSPNLKRNRRGWQTSESITFYIDDEKFWKCVNDKTITLGVQDEMQVQWIYEDNKTRPQKARVLKVISYNGDLISKSLSEKEIQKICEDKNILLRID